MNKRILFLLLCLIAMLSVSAVSAVDENVTEDNLNDNADSISEDVSYSSEVAIEDNSYSVSNSSVINNENTLDDVKSSEDTNFNIISSNESTTQNNIVDSGETPKTFTELNKIIGLTNGTLILDSNYKMTNNEANDFKYGITISKNIIIDGKGFTIDANKLGRIFNIASGTVSLINITLANGNSSGGGAIYTVGSHLNVSGCSFVNNSASSGGAIENFESRLSVSGCSFVNNSASSGGAIYNNIASFSVSGCSFVNNFASSGGAIYNVECGFSMSGCSFVNNSASSGGGAIYNYAYGLNMSGCDFVNNSASSGGAIYNAFSSRFSVSGCSFVNNSASSGGAIYVGSKVSSFGVSGCSFVNNSATYDGGAIYNGNFVAVSNSEFKDNNATKGMAIYNYGYDDGVDSIKATIKLNNNTYFGISEGKTQIYNNGTILIPLTITVLENKTIKTKKGESIVLFATITTIDGATVAGGRLNFLIDQYRISARSNDNGIYDYNYTVPFEDTCKVVGAYYYDDDGNRYVFTGSLDVMGVDLIVNDVTMIYKDGSRLYTTLLDAMGNPIVNATLSFTINGATYNKATDGNGIASIALNLEAGNYTATISYFGNRTTNVSANVTIKSSIEANDLVKLYQNGTQFYAKFLDNTGKVLANTDVRFNINGVFYTRTTGDDGVAKLSINLNPGKYILTAINPINNEQAGYNVVVKSLAEANDLTKYYKNESKFESKIYNKDGSLAINKEVKFNINGVFYTRTTDENGIARLGINLRPGDYVITTIVDGLESGNNVKVLPTLLANDLNMNFQDGSKFSTTILNGQGVPLPNQNVTFNVNGVFYNRVSNGDGVASLAINLLRGEYIITSMWNDYQVGNKITIS